MPRFLLAVALALFPLPASTAPVPKALKQKPQRAKIEPLPGEKLYSVDFTDESFRVVTEWLHRNSGLEYVQKESPDLTITLKAERVCMAELFAQLDDMLYPQDWVLVRTAESFSAVSTDTLFRSPLRNATTVTHDVLRTRSLYQPAYLWLPVGEKGVAVGPDLAGKVTHPLFKAHSFGTDQLIVRGRVMDLRQFVDDMGDHIKK